MDNAAGNYDLGLGVSCPGGEVLDFSSEGGEARVLGLAEGPAMVDLLEDHGQFEDSKDFVPGDVGNIATRTGGVVVDEFVASVPAGRGGAGVPVAEGESEVDKGVADGGHFP